MGALKATRALLPRAALLAALALAACASPRPEGVVHVVQPGENLYRIARFYGVSVESIVEANGVEDVHDVPVGTRLWIPGGRPVEPKGPLVPPDDVLAELAARRAADGVALHFAWPLRGQITSRFGMRHGRMHQGIDIGARRGTLVHCAEAGRVIYASRLGAYGKVVIVKHDGAFATVYAHNRRIRVRKGQRVARGQVIAEVGSTGNATGPHLHFEVRRDEHPRDPLRFLP